MARSKKPVLAPDEASVKTLDERVFFDCAIDGRVFAAKGLKFAQLKDLTPGEGKLIKISSAAGKIEIPKIVVVGPHETMITLTNDKSADELHIRIPIGVQFFRLKDVPKDKSDEGFQHAFYYFAGPGYNIRPLFLPLGGDANQSVKELVLITSQVPPRRDSAGAMNTEDIPVLSAAEFGVVQKFNPLKAKRAKRNPS